MTEQAQVGWQVSPSALKINYVNKYAAGATALDLGCGRGWYAAALADSGFQVTGMDQVNRVQDRRIDMIEQIIAPPLPFDDAAFDTVVLFDVLEHLPDEEQMLSEIARVCRQRLILSVPHADAGFLPRYGLTYLHYVDDTHLREYLPAELGEKLTQHGFRTLSLQLEGLPTIPLVFSEFMRGGRIIQQFVRYAITAGYKLGIITNRNVAGDIFYVGEKMDA